MNKKSYTREYCTHQKEVLLLESHVVEKKKDYVPLGVAGLGGWLILVQIGLYITILMLFIQLFQYSVPAFSAETWDVLTSRQSEFFHPLWGPVLIFETLYNIVLLVFCAYILVVFYGKKSVLPRFMIIFYSTSLIIGIIDFVLLYQIPLARELGNEGSIRDIGRSALACAIWIPYFIKSERVHNTFLK
jgi:hypothetical protein